MKSKNNYKSRKAIIITTVIVALLALSGTGIYLFTKGNDNAEAFTEGNVAPVEEVVAGEATEKANAPEQGQENAVQPNTVNNGEQTATTAETTTGRTNTTGTTTATTNATVPNQEYVTERQEEQERLVYEGFFEGWTPVSVLALTSDVELNKVEAEDGWKLEKTSDLVKANGNEDKDAELGDTINYTIKVTNTGNTTLKDISVDDEMINLHETIKVLPQYSSKEFTKSYTVKQSDIDAQKPIHNKAVAKIGDKEVPGENDVPVIEAKPEYTITKTATTVNGKALERDAQGNITTKVRVGDTIGYVITVENTGKVTVEKITVTDELANFSTEIEAIEVGNKEEIPVTYTVKESDVKNEKIVNVATAGNETDTEEVPVNPDVTVAGTKTWIDNDNKYNTRPESIVVKVLNGTKVVATKEVKATDNWAYTFKLPKYDDNNNEITYTVSEEKVNGYTLDEHTGYDLTNRLAAGITSVDISKKWVTPVENVNTLTATFELYRDNETEAYRTATISGNGTYTFGNLPKYNTQTGKEFKYEVREVEVNGYAIETKNNLDFTNRIKQVNDVDIKVSKTWVTPVEDKTTLTATFELYRNDNETEAYRTATISGNGTYTFEDLPRYNTETGKEYTYEVREVKVDGYTVETTDNLNFTNRIEQVEVEEIVSKVWDDENNQDGARPTSIKVQLYADDKAQGRPVTLTVANKVGNNENLWQYSFGKLPKYNTTDGHEIKYEIKEVSDLGEYTAKSETSYGETTDTRITTITNKYTPKTTNITVNKVWKDNDNAEVLRPDTLKVYIYNKANAKVKEINLTAVDGWTATVELPEYVAGQVGQKESYTVKELYNNQVVENNGLYGEHYTATYNKTTITNTLTGITTSINGTKTWENTEGHSMPETVVVDLYADGVKTDKTYTITVGDGTGNTFEFTDLEKYRVDANGNVVEIKYTVQEENVPNYESTIDPEDKYHIINTWKQDVTGLVTIYSKQPTSENQNIPIDMVFVLDISASMKDTDGAQGWNPQTRAEKMVNAVNAAIKTARNKNIHTRVSVVLYSSADDGQTSATTVLIPLNEYSDYNKDTNFLTFNSWGGYSITPNVGNGYTTYVAGGTYTQKGIEVGAQQLIGEPNKKYRTEVTDNLGNKHQVEVTRKPVIMLLTDGKPTYYTDEQGNQQGNGWDTYENELYYTIKAGKKAKDDITSAYGTDASFYTISFGATKQNDTNNRYLVEAVLNPTKTNINRLAAYGNNTTHKKLYNLITANNTSAGAYDYATKYSPSAVDTDALTAIFNQNVEADLEYPEYNGITEEQAESGKVLLPSNLDTNREFTIKTGNTTIVSSFSNGRANGYIGQETDGTYYINLTKIAEKYGKGIDISVVCYLQKNS